MARWEPPVFADWSVVKLKERIRELRAKQRELDQNARDIELNCRSNKALLREMQAYLIRKSGLEDLLDGWVDRQ